MSILDPLWFNPSLAKAGDGLSQEMHWVAVGKFLLGCPE
jgi:hypothetical protein